MQFRRHLWFQCSRSWQVSLFVTAKITTWKYRSNTGICRRISLHPLLPAAEGHPAGSRYSRGGWRASNGASTKRTATAAHPAPAASPHRWQTCPRRVNKSSCRGFELEPQLCGLCQRTLSQPLARARRVFIIPLAKKGLSMQNASKKLNKPRVKNEP